MPSTNQVANTATTNIVPVQGLFDQNGVCLTLIGPGGEYFWPQASSVSFGNVTNQPVIEVYDRSASIAIGTTPALLKPASTLPGSSGITYDAATGVFTFEYGGSYSLAISLNITATSANQYVYLYAEKNTGSGWVLNANSGKYYELKNNLTVQYVNPQAVARVAGEQTRYWIYSNGTNSSLDTQTLPGTSTVYVPAIRIQYS